MADVEIIDLDPKLSPDGTELLEIQEAAGGAGTSFKTPLSNLIGPQGPQGDPGTDGADGADGQNATADAGTTTTTAPGSNALVTNSGTTQNAVFDFDIPRGDVGAQGIQGDQGIPGNDGADGADGAAATADAGTTSTLPAGSNATVTNVGTVNAAVFDFGIPQGDKGDTAAGYNLIGSETVATLNALTAASITTSDAYIMLDGSPPDLQPIGATQPVTVATGDLVVWAEGDYFVNYGTTTGGVTDHGALSGLGDDDHSQYHTDARGDVRYYTKAQSDAAYATTAQGATADTATQPGDNVSTLTNDAGYQDQATTDARYYTETESDANFGIKAAEVPAGGGANQTLVKSTAADYDMIWSTPAGGGDVSGPALSVDNRLATFDGTSGKLIQDSGSLTTDFATAAQGVLADSAMQPGDNISDLNNNAGYGQGDVTGDTSSVNNRIATFFGTNGKVIQDSGSLVSDFATVAQATGSVTQHSDVTNAGSGAIITTGERNAITANTAKVSADGSIATHSDVTLTTPADKEGLVYNGAAWVNGFPYESGSVLPSPAGYPEGFLFLVTT